MHLRIAASRAAACCPVCVAAGGLSSITATNAASRPREDLLVTLMVPLLGVSCPRRAASLCPVSFAIPQRWVASPTSHLNYSATSLVWVILHIGAGRWSRWYLPLGT